MQRSLFALPFYCLLGILSGFVSITFIKSISYVGAGCSGGVLAPFLVLGALLGGSFGVVVEKFFLEWVATYTAYGLIGMGAILSGVTMAPITAIFTIF
jgi:CIC family chloride channel protein